MKVVSINPTTEEVNKEFETISKAEALAAAKKSKLGFEVWSKLDINKRAEYLRKLANVLRQRKEEFAKLVTVEMGKPIKDAITEVEKCAWTAEYYAENAEKFLEEEIVQTEATKSYVAFEPLGTVLSIMPWNFPFWQALRFGIPALTAGNVVLLRHSNVVPQCALAIEQAFNEFPQHVFKTLITDHDTVAALIRSKYINGVSLTGSNAAGARVAQLAGKHMKKAVFELGGSDPFIVLEDADVKFACENAAKARLVNTGQSCISAKRFIVVKQIAGQFADGFVESMKSLKMGDPLDMQTDIGPLATSNQREQVELQLADAVGKGANILLGGKRPEGRGYFFEPTVVTNTKPNMRVVKEEVFGPVAPIIIAKNEEHAIKIANDSEFGLGASVWTSNIERGERIARRLEAGFVSINKIVKSDPRLPFGGIKKSGIGRELSHYGLREFVNIKTVVVG